MSKLPLDAGLPVRVPRLAGLVAALLVRAPPGTPLRRRLLSRVVVLGFLLNEREDYEHVARLMYESDSELRLHGYDAMGLPDRYTGRAGLLATYNVHGCVGMDGQRSEDRIAEVIASMSADIVGLQELDLGRARSADVDQAALIAEELGWKYYFHPAMRRGDEQYGNAIVSRFPIALKRADEMPGVAPWYCRSATWPAAGSSSAARPRTSWRLSRRSFPPGSSTASTR